MLADSAHLEDERILDGLAVALRGAGGDGAEDEDENASDDDGGDDGSGGVVPKVFDTAARFGVRIGAERVVDTEGGAAPDAVVANLTLVTVVDVGTGRIGRRRVGAGGARGGGGLGGGTGVDRTGGSGSEDIGRTGDRLSIVIENAAGRERIATGSGTTLTGRDASAGRVRTLKRRRDEIQRVVRIDIAAQESAGQTAHRARDARSVVAGLAPAADGKQYCCCWCC